MWCLARYNKGGDDYINCPFREDEYNRFYNELINAEADSTRVSLLDDSRPTMTITIEKIDEYNLAQLMYMLEMQTAIAGELYNINTFNQPGVEQAINYTYALMGRPGYDGSAEELRAKLVTL